MLYLTTTGLGSWSHMRYHLVWRKHAGGIYITSLPSFMQYISVWVRFVYTYTHWLVFKSSFRPWLTPCLTHAIIIHHRLLTPSILLNVASVKNIVKLSHTRGLLCVSAGLNSKEKELHYLWSSVVWTVRVKIKNLRCWGHAALQYLREQMKGTRWCSGNC